MTTYPFRNLAFQGGGIKTYAYHGALPVLEEQGILENIERVVGTSAGAMLAALISFRLSAAETVKIYSSLDFSKIPTIEGDRETEASSLPLRLIEPGWHRIVTNVDAVNRLLRKFGWHDSSYGYQWMQDIIADQCQGNGRATFAEFRRRGFRDLHVVTTNISTHRMQIFCAHDTPDVAVADALLMSQTIPLYFMALQFDGRQFGSGDYYGDGGIVNNYPIHIFDHPRFEANNKRFIQGVNWETLGLRLVTPEDCPNRSRPVSNLIGYIGNLAEALYVAQEVAFENNQADQKRTININDCCVSTVDFHINARLEDPIYTKLVKAGQAAAISYLNSYQPPLLSLERGWIRMIRQGVHRLAGWRERRR